VLLNIYAPSPLRQHSIISKHGGIPGLDEPGQHSLADLQQLVVRQFQLLRECLDARMGRSIPLSGRGGARLLPVLQCGMRDAALCQRRLPLDCPPLQGCLQCPDTYNIGAVSCGEGSSTGDHELML
jgi:hypothetical protein